MGVICKTEAAGAGHRRRVAPSDGPERLLLRGVKVPDKFIPGNYLVIYLVVYCFIPSETVSFGCLAHH